MLSAPGAAMQNRKLFVSRLDGPYRDLYERRWDDDGWIWLNHGHPQDTPITGPPGAAMLNEKLFVVTADGALWEWHWRADLSRWVWEGHGRPGNQRITGRSVRAPADHPGRDPDRIRRRVAGRLDRAGDD